MRPESSTCLIDVDGLEVALYDSGSRTRIVRDTSLKVQRSSTLGVVGESGCGKTMAMLALVGLLPEYAEVAARSVRWKGQSITLAELQEMRGSQIGFVFQDPLRALNPSMKVGEQIAECLRRRGTARSEARRESVRALADVGIREPDRCARQYPWELSGGMAQRVLIAIALAPRPELLIADEPTTAIDASSRRRVLDLIASLQRSQGLSVLLISHDLGVVRSQADEIAVMYAGRVVEYGDASLVTTRPRHPYTHGLIACTLDPFEQSPLSPISGEPPRPSSLGRGCAFRERCEFQSPACADDPPLAPLERDAHSRLVACWHPRGSCA